MTNLYEKFGCKNKYELWDKLKSNDPVVKDLREFIEYAKCNIKSPFKSISSPKDFADYYSSNLKDTNLQDNEFTCVFVNTKNIPIHHSIVELDSNAKDIYELLQQELKVPLKEGLSAGGVNLFLVRSKLMDEWKWNQVLQFFNDIQLHVMDEMVIDESERTLYSTQGDYMESIENIVSTNRETMEFEQFNHYTGYSEFSSFYAEEEILGLNMITDRQAVMKNLKLGYQHEAQEYLGVIAYDDLNFVVSVEEVFIGGSNSAIVDHKIILQHILAYEEAKGIAIFHNHPSGVTDPSPEDTNVTERIQSICESAGFEFLDHYIVGKESVYSYERSHPFFVSSNEDYCKSVQYEKQKFKDVEL